jgi:hypothetical protein
LSFLEFLIRTNISPCSVLKTGDEICVEAI